MPVLQFNEDVCATCPTADCLVKCQYLKLDRDDAHREMMKIVTGEDSSVLHDCVTCYGCEEYCPRGNHPYYLICERREEKGYLHRPPADYQPMDQYDPDAGQAADRES